MQVAHMNEYQNLNKIILLFCQSNSHIRVLYYNFIILYSIYSQITCKYFSTHLSCLCKKTRMSLANRQEIEGNEFFFLLYFI